MEFRLTEEQKGLVALAKDFGKREMTPEFITGLEGKPLKDRMSYAIEQGVVNKFHDVGLKMLTVPERYGGGGADLLTQVVVMETLAQCAGPLAGTVGGSWKLCGDLAVLGSEEQQDWLFTRMMNDPTFFMGEAISEPEHGNDPVLPYDEPGSGMDTFAYRDGGEYVINGEKCFIGGAATDQLLFVYLRTDKNKPLTQSTSLILVPTDTSGYSVQRINEFIHDSMRPNGDPLFDNVRVPVGNLVGGENRGYPIMEGRRGYWLVLLAGLLGTTQGIYETTKEYAKTRVQGGRPIFEHPTVGIRIVDMYSKIEQTRLLMYKTAWEYDQANLAGIPLVSSLGFNLCTAAVHDLQLLIAEHVAEVWGGRAALKGLPVESYIRVAWGNHPGHGTATFNRIKCMSILDGNPYLNI